LLKKKTTVSYLDNVLAYFQLDIAQRSKKDMHQKSEFLWLLEADLLEMRVRLSIFTIISVCAGLPALVWSVSDLIHHRKNGHRISVFIILLLLTDFVEIFLSPYIMIKLFLGEVSWYRNWICWVFLSSRECGILLNQLVALEGILSVKYPLYSASVFSSPCFTIFYILVFLCIIIGKIVLHPFYYFFLAFLVSVITWIISCGASCSADRHSHTSRKPDHHILVVFMFTLLVLYLLYFLFVFFLIELFFPNPLHIWLIPYFLRSVRLISDPLLCVLVCRQSLRIQTSLKPEETSLV